jgi:hypothetical protein
VGYTHHWRRPGRLPARKFRAAAEDCRKVVETLCRERRFRVQRESDGTTPPVFDRDAVRFNGEGDLGHETFHVPRVYTPPDWQREHYRKGPWGDFCKTARKPYDLAVCACLIVLRHHLGGKFGVSSDGGDDEEGWAAARAACQAALGYGRDFTLTEPIRFTRRGLGYEADRHDSRPGRHGRAVYRLANGWWLTRPHRPHSGQFRVALSEKYQLPMEQTERYREFTWFRTLAEAQWAATCRFLRREFKAAPYLDEFVTPTEQQPGEWTGLLMWADKLDDVGSPFGPRLRAHLPR